MQIDIYFVLDRIAVPALELPSRELGACVEFLGIVRETEGDCTLAGLNYEAYRPMADEQMKRIFEALATEHPCEHVTFIHRLGWVAVGEASLFLRVLATHRAEALAFCGRAIDRMKQDVPIWKAAASV